MAIEVLLHISYLSIFIIHVYLQRAKMYATKTCMQFVLHPFSIYSGATARGVDPGYKKDIFICQLEAYFFFVIDATAFYYVALLTAHKSKQSRNMR